MNTFLKIAWRNIIRNTYRSLITIGAVAFGLAALIFIHAFVEGGDSQMIENYTDLIPGHLQIHRKGFHRTMGLNRSIEKPDTVAAALGRTKGVIAYAPRIKEYVLVSSAEGSSGVLLMGVDPAREKEVTYLHKGIWRGEYLGKDENGIVVGTDLAALLKVGVRDKIVVMAQGADGSLAAAAYRITGILDSGAEEIDRGMALITLGAAQDLLVLGDRISEIAVRTDSVYRAEEYARALRSALDTGSYEVLSWRDIAPMIAQFQEFDRAFTHVILFVVLLIVASGILNTVLMSVLERIREFGIMLAVGTKRSQIVLMVALESALLGIAGTVLGIGFGLTLTSYFNRAGIDLSQFASALESYYAGSVIYPRVSFFYVAGFAVTVFLVSIIVSLYPALKAARLTPVKALRHF